MNTQRLWACQANKDTTEGRGPMFDVCYAKTKTIAMAIVNNPLFYKRYGVQGCPPYKNGEYDVKETNIIVVDSAEEFFAVEEVNERLAALEKLTDREKELLKIDV
jgi:hypothetical protein